MKKKVLTILAAMLLLTAFTACAAQQGPTKAKGAVYTKTTAKEAKTLMDDENLTDIVILDVREQSEFDEGHIPNALLIPEDELEKLAEEKLPDKDATILVYCRSGRRSEKSARLLVKLGYTEVLDFGGIIDWEYETVK